MQAHEYMKVDNGTYREAVRPDAVKHAGRLMVPTTDETKWIGTWAEFKAAGASICFHEDQSGADLILPAPYKLSIRFPNDYQREAARDPIEALRKAESFISGFEGDERQEGIDEMLSDIRAAIAQAEGRA